MRVHLCVVGRLRTGPERQLIDDYLARFEKTGRGLGLTFGGLTEVDARKGGMAAEAELLEKALPKGGKLVVLDERGKDLTSPQFSDRLAGFRDQAAGDVAFVIGGADGLDPRLRARADLAVSFGRMVWPHMLVRVMLAEQLYRAASILARSPYHRV